MTPVDLLLVEGFKRHPHPKLEIYRPSVGKPLFYPDDPDHRRGRLRRAAAGAAAAVAAARRCGGDRRFHPRPCRVVAGMAQLSDDCFAFGGALMRRRRGARAASPSASSPVVEAETVPLRAAAGRILARDVVAADRRAAARQQRGRRLCRRPSPILRPTARPYCRSAAAPPRATRSAARSRRGEAIRIFTGAPMPDGADTVLMQEDCIADGGGCG